jgi:hypothetical protein
MQRKDEMPGCTDRAAELLLGRCWQPLVLACRGSPQRQVVSVKARANGSSQDAHTAIGMPMS